MVFPLIVGLVGAGIHAATEAGKAIAAANAPKPISPDEIRGIYDEEQQRASRGAYSQSMHALSSLAGSGGSAGSQASARRAAQLQAPEAMSQATMAGIGAGTNSAAARVGDMTGARQRQTNQALDVADAFGRVGHSAGIMANDLKSGMVAQQALGYGRGLPAQGADMESMYPSARVQPRPPARAQSTSDYKGMLPEGYGTMSDEHSKMRIQELEGQNASLQAQLAAASGQPNGARAMPQTDQSRRVPDIDELSLAQKYAPMVSEMGRAGTPVDIDELEGLGEDGEVVPPPANDPKYDTYVAPKPKKTPGKGVKANISPEEAKRLKAEQKKPSMHAFKAAIGWQ